MGTLTAASNNAIPTRVSNSVGFKGNNIIYNYYFHGVMDTIYLSSYLFLEKFVNLIYEKKYSVITYIDAYYMLTMKELK